MTGAVFSVRQETKFWLFFFRRNTCFSWLKSRLNFVRWKDAPYYECCLKFWCSFSTGYPAVDSSTQLNYTAGCCLRDYQLWRLPWSYKVSGLHREVCTVRFAHPVVICSYIVYVCLSQRLYRNYSFCSHEISPWEWRQKMSPKRFKQMRIPLL